MNAYPSCTQSAYSFHRPHSWHLLWQTWQISINHSDRSRAAIIRAQQRDLHFRARSHCLGYPSYSSKISPLPVHIHIWTLIRPVGSSIESVPTSQFSSRSESSRRGPQMTESPDSRCRAPRSIHKWVSAFHETDVPDPRPYFRSQSFVYRVK